MKHEIRMDQYTPCEYEHKLTKHLNICQHLRDGVPKKCIYRIYSSAYSINYCMRKKYSRNQMKEETKSPEEQKLEKLVSEELRDAG